MLIKVCSLAGRNRVAVLVVAVVLAIGLGVLRETASRDGRDLIFLTGIVVIIGSLALALAAIYGYHPAALVVRPDLPAFETHPPAGQVLLFAALTVQGGTTVTGLIMDAVNGEEYWTFGLPAMALWLIAIGFAWWQMLRPGGVRLRPDGVEDRQPFGSMFVPWEAFTGVPYPALVVGRSKITLTFADSALVRTRGWRPIGPALPANAVDARFLTYAIHEYAHRPELRAVIGTEAEYDRLTGAWRDWPNVG
ncbi:PH domain-containing protein [Actinoplanes derwentensis]|uniref:PH domain-containing protein n=1 Tax=Actinoplanes derwentensis TaxID=113562 RepID=UPI0012FE00FD|nr:PH domain-containing protein [Actinoplanes derwentensis]